MQYDTDRKLIYQVNVALWVARQAIRRFDCPSELSQILIILLMICKKIFLLIIRNQVAEI
jgi:hypothetical protein